MFSLSPDDDDGAFSGPAGGGSSKLANLFGHDKASFTGGNESLKYTAPKQPKKEKPAPAQGEAPVVVFATAVHVYKFVDNQYQNQGKLGAAVLANHATPDYKILLYAAKQQQVAIAKIYHQFPFTVQANNYASFCDDQRQRWSICFDSAANASQFAKQIGLALYNMQPSSLCTQDLVLGDSQPVEVGDGIEVKYTGWLWTNNTFGKVFDSNAETEKTFKFRTGKGKVIKGWDQGVIGMKRGGKRFIGIPPALAYGEKGVGGGRVPPNASLLFVVEIIRIKSKDGADSSSRTESPITVSEPKEISQPAPSLPNITTEPSGVKKRSDSAASIKGRTASLSEQLSQSPGKNSDKAKLLARMSKMGKNVLSSSAPTVTDIDDEDEQEQEHEDTESSTMEVDTEHQETPPSPVSPSAPKHIPDHGNPRPRTKPHVPQRPVPVQPHPEVQHHSVMPNTGYPAQQVALYQAPQPMPMNYPMMQPPQPQFYQQAPFPAQAFPQPQPPPQAPPQSIANDALVPVLMAETRQQQSEVRIAIGKVSDKLDEVLNKVRGSGALVPAGPGSGIPGNGNSIMEASVLLHNITRIVQENEKLKTGDNEKSLKIESLNEKIAELLHRNQQFLEKSNVMLEHSSNSLQNNSAQSQARVLSLEQEKINQTAELTELKTRLNEAETQLAILRKQESEMKSQANKASLNVTKYQEELEHTKEVHEEKVAEVSKLKQDLKEEKQTRKRVESRADRIEEEIADIRHEKESLEKSITDRKRKQTQDKRRFEEELEELKNQQEDEIQKLKERHRRDKKSEDPSAEKIAELENEIEARWTAKSAKMVSQCKQKWERKYEDVVEEKDEVTRKLTALNEKLSEMKSSQDDKEDQIQKLQNRIDDLTSEQEKDLSAKGEKDVEISQLKETIEKLHEFESKYHNVSLKAEQMKEQFEEVMSSRVTESYQKGLEEGQSQGGGGGGQLGKEDVAAEVKKIMNNMFYMFKSEFTANDSYEGGEVMSVILRVIKAVTLKHISKPKGTDEVDEEEEDEESEEESEEEEEEDEESEEDEDESEEDEEDKEEDDHVSKEAGTENQEKELGTAKTVAKADEEETDEEEEEEEEEEEDEEEPQKTEETSKIEEQAIPKPVQEVQESEHETSNKQNETENQTKETIESTENVDKDNDEHSNENGQSQEEASSENVAQSDSNSKDEKLIEKTKVKSDSEDDSDDSNEGPPPFDESEEAETDTDTKVQESTETPHKDTADTKVQESTETPHEDTADTKVQESTETPHEDTAKTTDNTAQSKEKSANTLDSIFGDDSHDDVEATFGPITKKPDLDEPSKPTPPPLFDNDDDDEDDIDWFK